MECNATLRCEQESLLNAAIEAHQCGDLDKAQTLYESVLKNAPENADALALLGVLYEAQGRYDEAIAQIKQAIQIDPKAGLFFFYLGNVLRGGESWPEAVSAYRRAGELQPDFAQTFFFLGLSLNRCGAQKEALQAYEKAFALQPDNMPEALYNAALTHQLCGNYDAARAALLRLIDVTGQNVTDEQLFSGHEHLLGKWHFHLALLELLSGDYARGFARYRARFCLRKRPAFSAPLWHGENPNGKTILFYAEKGFGDALMLVRYLPMVKEKGARVVLICKAPLVSLFSSLPCIDEIIEEEQIVPLFDFYASLFDLPHIFGTTTDTIPLDIPYLSPPVPKASLQCDLNKMKVGLVWAGNPAFGTDRLRSLPFSDVMTLFDSEVIQEKVSFYNLTREATEEEVCRLQEKGAVNLVSQIKDFSDAARFISQLDLIICCDTALAHLAGALGKKVWILVTPEPDWRWGLQQEEALWYPSMRIFRQSKPEDWKSVMKTVCAALETAFQETAKSTMTGT